MDHDDDQDQVTAGGPPPSEALSFVTNADFAEWAATEMAAAHGPVNGQHSHSHPSYGSQGSTERQRLNAIARELSARGVTPDVALLAKG